MKKFLVVLMVLMMTVSLFARGIAEEQLNDSVKVADLKVAAPSGAPALVLASLAVDSPENYKIIAADTITAEFAKNESDFIIAPLNAGAKLYKMGKSTYKLAAVVSWGNLFFASQKENFKLEDINGAEITLFGENTINSSIALFVLKENGIVPAKVNYLAGAANTQQLLITDANAIVMTAEPALTAARNKKPAITGYAVNDLYKNATGNIGFTQAGLFVKADLITSSPNTVKTYLEMVNVSTDKCNSDVKTVAEAAVKLEILPNMKVATASIPNITVRFVPALEAKEQVEVTANIDIKQFGGALPADDFYYGEK
ncbi:MAG: hypothetical protein K6G51_00045 [Sphaerochaetaceae bacterium]|nr:hypothetical protein [Sphaerochaetaceae bacterium]